MQMDVMNGGKVMEKLQNSPIWASYKDQKHDLFLEVCFFIEIFPCVSVVMYILYITYCL